MVRWNSLGVYTPMFRNHAIQGSKMREPWEWGKGNEQIIKKDIEQRYKILPYLYSSFYQSTQTGLPVSRTLAIEHSFDGNVFDERFQNEFMFGDAMLVAPVESTKLTEDVYLPRGSWYRLSSDRFYEGEQIVNVQAPLTDLPVFVRAGGIIPMQSVVQSTNEKGDGILQVHVWNGREANSFVYYEDDGVSYDYEQDIYYKRTIAFNPIEKTINLSSVEGSFKSRFMQLRFVLHGFDGVKLQEEIIENKSGEIEVKL
ncbi:TIM-barrel domain-containing protein [Mucilaginibacter sp. P19]